ncbi:MAG: rRNA maturation RNase YbeY [Candidatus Protochlamydia sp.]|nr:rRNA maturation RNase YbeY [Candidatus Protochlamydia sp.]
MIINIFNQQESLKFAIDRFEPLIKQVLLEEKCFCNEVSVYLVDTETISSMHLQYFGDPSPTDCISFPLDEDDKESPYIVLGDVFICPETAINYAINNQLDPYEETTLYLVHALLHLMGYDDIEENDLIEMRKAEKMHLEKLKLLNLCLVAPR